ncbi:phosphoserine phosphatase SerB [Aliidiomarina iranensis]|uniref:Phosphoserine phosphatase n=1 Tax=Aliidiomarina iranensis TaxID=1434071 RepID=A0A432VT74_9GAMM|nr:phosphoserine phosphatase SerB [Aliidiomarina iranensis]RUO19596.1 phosphoserine phosphatase SerB [Aliidiomarina iranensis]
MSTLPDMHKPGLAVFDMDSTLIQLESIDAIAAAAGHGEAVAEITERAMRGELDFKEALYERVKMLAGVPEDVVFAMADNLPYTEGADELMRFLRKHRWRIAIVSGGFTYFADMAAMRWGADYVACNVLEVADGKLTGRLLGPIVDAEAKADALKALMRQYGLPREQVVAIGDGANDIAMIEAAGLGVAFNAKPALAKVADIQIEGSLAKLIEVLA